MCPFSAQHKPSGSPASGPIPVLRYPATGPQGTTADLLALAASGERIAGTQSVPEWKAQLVTELAAHIPGASAVVYLANTPAPLSDSADNMPLRAPLWVGETYLGQVIVQPVAATPLEESRARLLVLAQMAAPRLASLISRALPGTDPAALDLLQRVQPLGRVLDDPLGLPALYKEVVQVAGEVTGADSATLLLEGAAGGALLLQAAWGAAARGVLPRAVASWSVADRVLGSGEPVRIEHAPSDPRYTAPTFEPPARALVSVPLRYADRVVGTLSVTSFTRAAAFTPVHVDVLATLAHYASTGHAVAELLNDRQEQIRIQSGLYAISRRIQATPDIEAALPEVLAVLTALVGAAGGEVVLTPYAEGLPGGPAYATVAWGAPPPAGEDHSLTLPLCRGAHDLGRIVLWRPLAPGPFRAEDAAVAGAVADHLALALENRSLLARDLAVLYEAPVFHRAPLDLDHLMRRLLAQAQALATVPGGVALLYDADTDDWAEAATSGDLPPAWPLPLAAQHALLAQARRDRAPLLTTAAPLPADNVLLVLPLLADDRVVGAFLLPGGVGSAARRALEVKLPFLSALAGRAGMLIDNMQLQMQAETLLIVEERQRIARDMHDDLAQSLTQIRNHCEFVSRLVAQDPERAVRELAEVRADLTRSAGEVVQVIEALRPLELAALDLPTALHKLAEEFTHLGRLQVAVRLPDGPLNLPPQIELLLYRVAQEALNHVAHRAGVDYCRIVLDIGDQHISFSLQDNGRSFNLPGAGAGLDDPHHRLRQLHKRLAAVGGTLELARAAETGAYLVVTIPREPVSGAVDHAGEDVI